MEPGNVQKHYSPLCSCRLDARTKFGGSLFLSEKEEMCVSFRDFLRMQSIVPAAVKYEKIWTTETRVDAGFTPEQRRRQLLG